MDSGMCYNCGAVYDRPDGGRCPDCGTVIVKNELPKVEKRLSAAFLLLRESQFDEAKTAFEAILKKYPENALAYWGRFRARYHITYVLNAEGKQVAKCPTESGANVFEDADYLKATEYANEEEKAFLQAQAERIKAFCTERTFSKNRVVRFTLGEVDPNDAFVMPPKSKKPLILSAVLAFMLIAATSVCFATGVFHKHEPGEWVIVTPATKMEDGLFVQYCDRCGKIATSKAIPAIGSKGLVFSQNYDETYSVFVGTCTDAEVVIPATYEGEPVTSIGSYAFEDCSSLMSIVIPDSVTSIGSSAFYGCSELTSIVIPDSVTSIGSWAFEGCSSLTSIQFSGTIAQWNAISFGDDWNRGTGDYTVTCTDGTVGTVTYH